MNIYELRGIADSGLIVAEMVELNSLKQAIEYGTTWAKKEGIHLQSVKEVYHGVKKQPNKLKRFMNRPRT